MIVTSRTVTVEWSFDGYHRWPAAADIAGPQRAYLVDRHRHRFVCTVTIPVDHSDRAVEFHDLLDHCAKGSARIDGQHGQPLELDTQSCEQLAERIALHVLDRWPDLAWIETSVSEDGYVTGTIRMEAP